MAGELALLWRALVERRPCACLRACTDCPVWKEILDRALAHPDVGGRHAADLYALRQRHVRVKQLPRLLARRAPDDEGWRALAAATGHLYQSMAEVSGAEVIVDSSKWPATVAFLRRVPGIDLRVVHLVRDPRGVGASWSREKSWSRDGWDEALYPKSLSRATAGWVAVNGLAEAMRLVTGPRRTPRVRFEDFLSAPEPVLRSLVDLAGLPQPPASELPVAGGAAVIRENHAIGGNVDRFQVGPVPLRSDDGWRRRLSPVRQRAVAAATFPLMRRYGYR